MNYNPKIEMPAFLDPHRLINVRQMADALGFSINHVRRLYSSGQIPKPIKIGGRKLAWKAQVLIDMTSDRYIGDAK